MLDKFLKGKKRGDMFVLWKNEKPKPLKDGAAAEPDSLAECPPLKKVFCFLALRSTLHFFLFCFWRVRQSAGFLHK